MDWKLELVVVPVSNVDRARTFYTEKAGFNLDVDHRSQVPGPEPGRRDYGSFFSFGDPDGNGWLVQEVRRAEVGA